MSGQELYALKQAEHEAMQIITMAREERRRRLKEAAREAQLEIEEYKSQREDKLRHISPEDDDTVATANLARSTDDAIAKLQTEFEQNSDKVIDLVLKVVTSIENPFGEQ